MACGGCGKHNVSRSPIKTVEDVKGGYKYLTDAQIRARLEVYKRNNCKNCDKRYQCDYSMFLECKKFS